jgi:uncharacterized protein YlxW (UPF0749 family)
VVINGEITAADAQDLINELWKAGAEAIAIGDQRLVVSRPIQRGDAGLIVNGTQLRSPYVVKALGEADPLASSLDQRGGFASVLRAKYPNIRVTVNRMVDQTLPTYRGTYEFRFARSVD